MNQLVQLVQKACFRLRARGDLRPWGRRLWWSAQGARFGRGTGVPRLSMTWPHQVGVGRDCQLEDGTFFKFDGIWQPGPRIQIGDRTFIGGGCEFNIRLGVSIGRDCLIASGCRFIDHDHGMSLGEPMNRQLGSEAPIVVEDDVWLGVNVVVLKGVTIRRGAVVAAGAVVTKSIGAGEIWGGVPARKLRDRAAAQSEAAQGEEANGRAGVGAEQAL